MLPLTLIASAVLILGIAIGPWLVSQKPPCIDAHAGDTADHRLLRKLRERSAATEQAIAYSTPKADEWISQR